WSNPHFQRFILRAYQLLITLMFCFYGLGIGTFFEDDPHYLLWTMIVSFVFIDLWTYLTV
ncbi:hypothetical protein ACJX0J_038526, partial [Zea mays]